MRIVELPHLRFEKFIDHRSHGCQIWKGAKNKWGRGRFFDGNKVIAAAHFSYRFYKDPLPSGQFALPTCGNVLCVAPAHLKLFTRSQIARRAIKSGKWNPVQYLPSYPLNRFLGSLNGNSRYSDSEIKSIKQERASGHKLQVIALRRHMPVSSVAYICSRRLEP